jgi:hypothetical protein
MDLFISLALLVAISILCSVWQRDKIIDPIAFRKTVSFFIAAVVVHNPLMELLVMIPHIGFAIVAALARIFGYVLLLISFYALCRAWGAPLGPGHQPRSEGKL